MFWVSKLGWFMVEPSNLLAFGLLAGLIVVALGRRWIGLGLAGAAWLALVLCGLGPVGEWLIEPLEGRFPAPDLTGQSVVGVIVLGGAAEADVTMARAQLSMNESGERLVALADLGRRFPQAQLVFTGGSGGPFGDTVSEADAVEAALATLGLPAGRVIFERVSRNTAENASFTKALVQPQAGETWLLVTSAWHMPRAMGVFRRTGFAVTAYPVDFRTRGDGTLTWTSGTLSRGLRRTDVAVREWLGLLAYRALGRTEALLPAP